MRPPLKLPLYHIATARSGDKGANVNIGLIARDPKHYELLKEHVTEQRVAEHFAKLSPKKVVRYELPNLGAFNFILYNVLDGGGSLSLRIDPQGKTFGQALLLMELELPEE